MVLHASVEPTVSQWTRPLDWLLSLCKSGWTLCYIGGRKDLFKAGSPPCIFATVTGDKLQTVYYDQYPSRPAPVQQTTLWCVIRTRESNIDGLVKGIFYVAIHTWMTSCWLVGHMSNTWWIWLQTAGVWRESTRQLIRSKPFRKPCSHIMWPNSSHSLGFSVTIYSKFLPNMSQLCPHCMPHIYCENGHLDAYIHVNM